MGAHSNTRTEINRTQMIHVVLAGCLTLAVVMGIGRFAYTPIFPLMQEKLSFSEVSAGFLASINYLGYLLGAILAGMIRWGNRKIYHLKIHLILNIITTIAMAASTQFSLWMLFRLISGITSGLVFVLASSIILDFLAIHKRPSWSGYFFSGTGVGIVLTGVLVPVLATYFTWRGAWLGLGGVSTLFCLYIFKIVSGKTIPPYLESNVHTDQIKPADVSRSKNRISPLKTSNNKRTLKWLIIAYVCEGFGYIITGTFLVAMVEQTAALQNAASVSWTLVGIAAIPSCVLWAYLGTRWGNLIALKVAYIVQAIGIILPIFSTNVYVIFLGAVLFGGTFMGITALAMSIARQLYPQESSRPIGYLTVAYGVGQIIGPSVAGILVSVTGNYDFAVLFAASILIVGFVFLNITQLNYSQNTKKSATL